MIKTFRVQNYKALRDVTLDLTPIHLLIGPNDSGKTSLLQSLKTLSDSLTMPLEKAFGSRWEGVDLVTDGNSSAHIVLKAVSDESPSISYEIECQFQGLGRKVLLVNEEIVVSNEKYLLRPAYQGRDISGQVERLVAGDTDRRNWFEPGLEKSTAEEVCEKLGGAQLFRWNARLLSLPCALDSASGFRMLSSGFGLSRVLDAIVGYDPRRFVDEVVTRYRKYFPDVIDIKLRPEKGFRAQPSDDELVPLLQPQDGKGIVVRFVNNSRDVPAAHLSEGMLLILAYLAILYSPNPPRLLLIEEPENGVHPERLSEVIDVLRDIAATQAYTQIILTSHSPYIVSLFQPEEVTLCRKNHQGHVEVKRLSESQLVKQQLEVFSLGEIWPAEEAAIFSEQETPAAVETPK